MGTRTNSVASSEPLRTIHGAVSAGCCRHEAARAADSRRGVTVTHAGADRESKRSGGASAMTTSHFGRRAASVLLGSVMLVGLASAPARADLTASYDGSFSVKKTGENAPLAGSLTQAGVGVSG